MGGFVCASHRRKNKGFPTLKRTLNLGIEKGRLLKNSRPKGGLIQVVCYPTSPETVDITGFFEKFCIAIRTKKEGHPYGCPSFLHWTQLGAAAPELRPSAYGVQMHRQSSSARYLILKDLLRPPFRRWKQGAAPDRISACRPPPNPRPNRGDFLCRSPRKSG